MNLGFILRVLRGRGPLRSHERWSRAQIDAHQATAVRELRRFAVERSPFYRRFHAGFESSPLTDLPVLTKAQLMGSFDDRNGRGRKRWQELDVQQASNCDLLLVRGLWNYVVAARTAVACKAYQFRRQEGPGDFRPSRG